MIYTIRTTSGREDIVIDLLMSKIQSDNIDVKSIFHPAEIKGYIFIEASIGNVHKAMQGLMHSRGLIEKPINIQEIQHFLESKKTRLKVDEGDIIEIIGGPFKGEKGRIKRINNIKDEITVELLEASIPIPVTIATEFVKMVKKKSSSDVQEPVKSTEKEDKDESVFDTLPEDDVSIKDGETKEKKDDNKEEGKEDKKEDKEEKKEEKKRKSFLEELEG